MRSDATSSYVIIPPGAGKSGVPMKLSYSVHMDFQSFVGGLRNSGHIDVNEELQFVAPLMRCNVVEGSKTFEKPVTIVMKLIPCYKDKDKIEVFVSDNHDCINLTPVPRKTGNTQHDMCFYIDDRDNCIKIETLHFCWWAAFKRLLCCAPGAKEVISYIQALC